MKTRCRRCGAGTLVFSCLPSTRVWRARHSCRGFSGARDARVSEGISRGCCVLAFRSPRSSMIFLKPMAKSHHIEWHGKQTAADNARRELPRLVSRYFALVREVLARNPDPAEL